jgi:hypothetical protein
VSAKDDIAAPKGKRASAEYAPIDERTRRGVMHGGRVILACAAGISFPNLYALGRIAGLPVYLAPLLPLSIDAYAYVAMWFADQVPARHPARASALRNGAVALAMSVACNVLDRFLVLAGAMVQPLWRDVLLSAVFALPPFIVGRVLHLRALADGGSAAPAVQDVPVPSIPKPRTIVQQEPVADQSKDGQPSTRTGGTSATVRAAAAVNDQVQTAQPSMDRWIEIGHPVYLKVKASHGKRPPEAAYTAALGAEAARLIAAGELPSAYASPSVSTAKRVRAAVEERFPELSALHLVTAQAS